MPIIDSSYFLGDINIPCTDHPDVAERIWWFIWNHEPKLLQKLMGYELYKAFTEGTAADDASTHAQRWKDLRDGKEYTDSSNRLQKWVGLVSQNNSYKRSLIANYVYYWYLRNEASQTTTVGEAQALTDNAARVSPAVKMSRAWNELCEDVRAFIDFMHTQRDVYPEWNVDECELLEEFALINPYNL